MAASIAIPHKGLADVVRELKEHRPTTQASDDHPQTPPLAQSSIDSSPRVRSDNREGSLLARDNRTSGYRYTAATPSGRTGPPRSISYTYSIGGPSRSNSGQEEYETPILRVPSPEQLYEDPDPTTDFAPATSPFRGALEYDDPEQREREREIAERKGKRKESTSYFPESWDVRKWIAESPKEGHTQLTEEEQAGETTAGPSATTAGEVEDTSEKPLPRPFNRRSRSLPHLKVDSKSGSGAPRWGRLRSLLPHLTRQASSAQAGPSAVVPQSVNITDELIAGGLSTLMLRLWFERDEKDRRRVPALFHRLKIRISDSLHPLHGQKAVFRIECEYANGAARWVVHRQLREFWSLHTHYAILGAYNRNVETLPDFPRTSLPYFKWLKEKGSDLGRADFARLQRGALENYLIGLIRAVMFHPSANRLAGFLEISALSIALAQSGGSQYKAGLLRMKPSGSKGLLGKRGTGWSERNKQRWCAVRESYLVVMEEMGELIVHDVFLIDQDFKIERPIRYYRQGLNLLNPPGEQHDQQDKSVHEARSHMSSRFSSIRTSISKIFHRSSHSHRESTANGNGTIARTGVSRPRSDSESSASDASRPVTPMLDPSTNTNPLLAMDDHAERPTDPAGDQSPKKDKSRDVSKHTFYVENSQMRLKLFARNERQMLQWIAALEKAARESHYTGRNRFDSFAPIRLNVAAQWLVDGRDYFWNLSRAILLARESIYIHDWWLSPELQMRRPGMDRYRLDRLLERKARDGVKIYIILYQEVSSRTTPTDSHYAKQRLTSLHPNIMVQRSPSHFQTGTFYWAHHEKFCVIDQAIAFMGGLDLCFGRWDTPQHVLVDDPEPVEDGFEHIWPGKDYSNPRVLDFHALNKPYEDMYDRAKVPRMAWHDVSMQVVGQPARDLARHFVQRWNHLLRIKNHSRTMPILIPPPEFRASELTVSGLTGTCELQICRSAGAWSLGTPDRTELSIQNAYLKAIQMSEHFVYIENQFFISATTVGETKIENRIGDALVHRIIRAHREKSVWRCCILIPLLPGFTFPVDHSDASAIRIILECQNRTLFRGPHSIYARLRKEGIDPNDYISVFSLRNWAKLRGDVLTTEQVYIHAKVCIVDDRLAIIGSANINERSLRGDRDSEIAAIIRDTDLIDCTMGGEPYKVGRFAHTLRVRLMREHLGVDVDAMYEDDLMVSEPMKPLYEQEEWDPDAEQGHGNEEVTQPVKGAKRGAAVSVIRDSVDGLKQIVHGVDDIQGKHTAALLRKAGIKTTRADATAGDVSLNEERTTFTRSGGKEHGFTSSVVPTLEEETVANNLPPTSQAHGVPIEEANTKNAESPGDVRILENGGIEEREPEEIRVDGVLYGAPANADYNDKEPPHVPSAKSDADSEEEKAPGARSTLRKHLAAKLGAKTGSKAWSLPTPTPEVDPYGFEDPICDEFWSNVWVSCASHNTEIYRKVFHAVPDDLVTTWKQYKEFTLHHERLSRPAKDQSTSEPVARLPSETGDPEVPGHVPSESGNTVVDAHGPKVKDYAEEHIHEHTPVASGSNANGTANAQDPKARKPAKGPEPFDQAEREEMERLLEELRGHLVLFPTRFLEGEDIANNFLWNADRLLPLPIYD